MEATLGLPLPRHPLLLPWHRHAHKQRNTSSCCWRTDGITFSVNVHALSFSSSAVLFRIRPNSTFSSSSILFNKTKVRRRSGALALLDLFSRQRTKKEDSIEKLVERPAYAPWDKVRMGPLQVAPMGMGTWAWGNKLLWGYTEAMDADLQNVFNLVVSRGVDLFDTADSYGTGRLNGRSEMLLGKFMKQYPGWIVTVWRWKRKRGGRGRVREFISLVHLRVICWFNVSSCEFGILQSMCERKNV
eukprot:TRINITY_DN1296_c0_g1_i1.p1 TRINITY_DN1296_c0_g1~~TRINITY_DN1296_c0_g1_i1.p1  ORF type:complete len:244 (+),score=31.04 TRINITY_DN1296_c0_g1_i1:3-734(+)